MDYLTSIAEAAVVWQPLLITLLISIIGLAIIRYVLFNRKQPARVTSGPYRQLFFVALVSAAVVAVILALPVGDSARGQLLSLFGLLVTAAIALSSTTFVGNAMAGFMLKLLRNIRPGDFLRVGDHVGRVSELGFLHTEIQTEDRDLTTIPNLHLVTHPMTVVRSSGTVVSAMVSLGYDVNRERVKRRLLRAAARAELRDPFVQIVELGDYSISYRAAGILENVKTLLTSRSRLRECILDELHAADIEIVSPTFMNQRRLDPELRFVPERDTGPRPRPIPDSKQPVPEAKIFDKADKAESEAKLEEDLKAIESEIESLDDAVDDEKDPDAKFEKKRELEAKKARKAELEATLDANDADEAADKVD